MHVYFENHSNTKQKKKKLAGKMPCSYMLQQAVHKVTTFL